ncbi:hypothetical protein QA640_06745 [Bradyrhizobium sp. CB82]|uniref:hypothetical protein n=1 Tax=Bradyrhizobium sp. CB82 TaxID=3039159 RepID=UPI0024B047AC|nr:hypothetical protein [Bradyrhizobium sp. CB82]WFU42171.1 hypothetical protein QA640_06745 [Bradyrhizobium sp. CB82]
MRWINSDWSCPDRVPALSALETRMAGNGLVPMADRRADHRSAPHRIVYLIVDNVLGRPGRARRKLEVERTDLETIIANLVGGHFNDPVRIVAFDPKARWSKNISRELAEEIQMRCDIDAMPVPEHIQDFVRSHRAAPASIAH